MWKTTRGLRIIMLIPLAAFLHLILIGPIWGRVAGLLFQLDSLRPLLRDPQIFAAAGNIWYGIWLGVIAYTIQKKVFRQPLSGIGWPSDNPWSDRSEVVKDVGVGALGAGALFGRFYLVGFIYDIVPGIAPSNWQAPSWMQAFQVDGSLTSMATLIDLFLLLGIGILFLVTFEELMYRGLVQTKFSDLFGPAVGILVATLAFMMVQVYPVWLEGGTIVNALMSSSLMGIIVGVIREVRGNLIAPYLAHVMAFIPASILFY